MRVLGEPLEVAPGREDQARLAAPLALSTSAAAEPVGARAFALDDARLPIAGRARRNEEQSVEAPHGVELRHPARERGQGVRVELEAMLASSSANGRSATRASCSSSAAARVRQRARGRPGRRFPRSSRGSRRRPPRRQRRVRGQLRGRRRRSARRERPGRRPRRPCRRRARPSAARAGRPAARAPGSGSRPGSPRRSSRPRRPITIAADVLLVGFPSGCSRVRRLRCVLSSFAAACAFVAPQRCRRFAASHCAASLASVVELVGVWLVHLGVLDRSSLLLLHAARASAAARSLQKPVFSSLVPWSP